MKAVESIKQKASVLNAEIEDLTSQQESNASKGNWTVVNAIRTQKSIKLTQKKVLDWVLSNEEV
jgi:hypothetical protein